MRKSFVYKKLIAFVVVLTLLFADCATMVSTQSARGGGGNGATSWEDQSVVFRVYDENEKLMSSGTTVTFNDSAKTAISQCSGGVTHSAAATYNGQYLYNNGVVVTPPSGYYVRSLVLCCDHNHGEGCNTRAQGNLISFGNTSYASAAYTITSSEFSAAQSDSNLSGAVFHDGNQGGKAIHIMIYLAKCPSPAYITYEANNTGLFTYTGTATTGNNPDAKASKLNQDVYSYTYQQGSESVPQASVLAVNPELIEAASEAGYKFLGWELQYYTTANATDSDVVLSNANGASSLISATYKEDGTIEAITSTVSMHLHAQLTAKWEKVQTYHYTVNHHFLDYTDSILHDETEVWTYENAIEGYVVKAEDYILSSQGIVDLKVPNASAYEYSHSDKSSIVVSSNENLNVINIYYKLKDYTVKFYAVEFNDDGSLKSTTEMTAYTQTLKPGASINVPTVTDDPSYSQPHWFTQEYKTKAAFDAKTESAVKAATVMPAENLTYYMYMIPEQYTVTYFLNGTQYGSVESYRYGDSVTVAALPKTEDLPQGHKLDAEKWTRLDSNGQSIQTATTFSMPEENIELYINSSAIEYFVTWILIDGSGEHHILHKDFVDTTEAYYYGEEMTVRAVPNAQNHSELAALFVGHDIDGWFTNEECTKSYRADFSNNEALKIVGDRTYYAKLTPKTYKISYHVDGKLIRTDSDITYNASLSDKSFPTVESNVYGWFTESSYPANLTEKKGENLPANMPAHDLAYYAWTNNTHYPVEYILVTEDLNGNRTSRTLASNEIGDVSLSYLQGTTIESATLPSVNGYAVTGWYSDADCKNELKSNEYPINMGTSKLTFYALAVPDTYKITYYLDKPDGTAVQLGETDSYKFGASVSVRDFSAAEAYLKSNHSGYSLSHNLWDIDPLDTSVVSNMTWTYMAPGDKFTMPATDIHMHIGCSINTYTVTHWIVTVDSEGNPSKEKHGAATFDYGESVTLVDVPTDPNGIYTYTPWYGKEDFSGEPHPTTFVINQNVDVYSKKTTSQYNVYYYVDGKQVGTHSSLVGDFVTSWSKDAALAAAGIKDRVINEKAWNVTVEYASAVSDGGVMAVDTDNLGSSVDFGSSFTMPAGDVYLSTVTESEAYNVTYQIKRVDGSIDTVATFTVPAGGHGELHPKPEDTDVYSYTEWSESVDSLTTVDAKGNTLKVEFYIDDTTGKTMYIMPAANVIFTSVESQIGTTYTIRYLEKYTDEEIRSSKSVNGKVGSSVVETQPAIDGWKFYGGNAETVKITLDADSSKNVITFYYMKDKGDYPYRVDYKVYDPRYDTGNPESDHIRYRTLDYYEGVAHWGSTVTAKTKTFAGYTEIPGQKKTIVISEYSNRIIVLYTDDSYDGTPDYYIQYFFNGVLDDSMTVSGEGNVGDVIRAEDYYLDDPTYTLVDVKPADEITLEIGVIGIINIYYEYEVEEPDVPAGPVIPVDPTTPEDPETPDEPIIDDPDNKDNKDDENKDDEEEPFVPQQPDNPVPPNTSDVSYVYGILAVMAALAAAGVLASKKLLR